MTLLKGVEPKDNLKEKSALLRKDEKVEEFKFTDTELTYLKNLRQKLWDAKDMRDSASDFFDGMNYIQRCEQNRKFATSNIPPKTQKEDSLFTTGISRRKLFAYLAAVYNLNLDPDITAYNKDSVAIGVIGEALEVIMKKSFDLEEDDEKKMMRIYTMIEQGEVFVQETWTEKFKKEKDLSGKFDGTFRGVSWTTKLKKVFEGASRDILQNERVYLGDITIFDMANQPFVFTMETKPYSYAESIYGGWEMFKYVDKNTKQFHPGIADATYGINWSLDQLKKDHVEIIKYQDPWNNEFQILINGIPMLPIGFPMPWKHGGYNIVKQVLEPIDQFFAYGRSLMQTLKLHQIMEDEFWRAALLKTQQSFAPPMSNRTGRVLSSKIFLPGKLTPGIDPSMLSVISDVIGKGVTQSEFNVMTMLRQGLDENSVNPQTAGQAPTGDPTATEVLETQKQAKVIIGLIVGASVLLEKKLAKLRLPNLLENWFEPVDKEFDELKGQIREIYRVANVDAPIEGEGMGQRMVNVVGKNEEIPQPMDIFKEEMSISESTGIPTRKIYLSREEILNSKYTWRIEVVPTEKETSPLQKVLFKNKASDYMLSPNFNMDWYEENVALTWGDNPSKVFKKNLANGVVPPAPVGEGAGGAGRVPSQLTKPLETPAPSVNKLAE